jgi:two-component system response regulator AtoC
LAEDEAVIRTMVARVLEKRGCRVIPARDGREAVALFSERAAEVDVVVLDVRMPILTGIEALAQIREIRPSVSAVLMSGFAQPSQEISRFVDSGVRFVAKPIRATVLAELIHELASRV